MADIQLTLKTVMESSDVISNINQIQSKLSSLKMPKDLTTKAQTAFDELKKTVRDYQNILDKPNKSMSDLKQLDQLGAKIKSEFNQIEKVFRNTNFKGLDFDKIDSPKLDAIRKKIESIQNAGQQMAQKAFKSSGLTDEVGKATGALQKLETLTGKMTARKGKGLFENFIGAIKIGDLAAVEGYLKDIQKYMHQQEGSAKPFKGFEEAKPIIKSIVSALESMTPSLSELTAESKQSENAIGQLVNELHQAANIRMDEMAMDARKIADGLDEAAHSATAYTNSMSKAMHQQTEMQYQVQNLQQQIKNYFGLDEIFRRIGDLARSAMDTVKELDAAMTETAVVTNFDVSDMWKMLPTYTKNANQLGSTIADVYNAATLYYQQGLTTSQSMDLANETLKMARIGGIEAAEATDMMTAALRGFNMEINQMSAQKINDVYSKLAAITAADTKEIGTAMERTASISKSANMDFETTSAFLAQMIETTREAPENLGTAMKTIVARFQEMKVDPNTLIDSEGERLDFNRVDKALKSVGISLVDQQNQFRNLDDVFLEISSRWDGMTQAQQRYIATIAAGSRQQSRFIAMMQDYDRTMELVDAAYTAEGAGQAQFEKTLESMDSKLNRLKNAWDQFAMGFMNADFLKVGVDTGTKFLDIFEKIITGISQIGIIDPFKGIIKSALTATAVFGGLLAMSKLLMAGIGKWASFVLKDDAANMGGMMGAAAKQYGGVNNRRQQLKEEAKIAAKQSREMNRQVLRESMSQDEGGFFSSLKTGEKAREEYRNFQKQMQKEMANGKMSFANFDKAFSNLSQPLKSSLAPQITNAFRQAVNSADIDGAAKEAALNFIEAQEALFDSGQLNINGLYENLKGNPNIDLDNINVDNLVHEIAPMSKIDEQFNKIGNGAAKAGQSIQMFGANLMGTPLQPFGTALMVVGQGIENIGMLMGNGLTAIKKWGASMVATGASTLAAGQSANTASLFFRGLGVSIKEALAPLLPFIAIAAVAAAAIAGIYLAATQGERALKKQGDAAAQASQDLDTTKQALEAVNNDLTELANNDASLDSLIEGTTEWNNQLAEANAHIIEMMGNYKTLNDTDQNGEYKYINTDDSGRMSITEAGQEAIRKEYQNAVNLATANNAVQGALYNNLKDIESKQYKNNQTLITTSNMAQRQGGAITSADEADIKRARLENENIQKQNTARLENAWKTGLHSAISDLGIRDTKAIENILTSQRDSLVNSAEIAHGIGARKENEKQYAELMGYEWTDKGKYKDAQGNELNIEYDAVKEALPELQAIADAQGKAASIESSLTAAQSNYNEALKAGSKRQKELEGQSSIISDILSSNTETNFDVLESFINAGKDETSGLDMFLKQLETYSDENAKTVSDLTGIDLKDIYNQDTYDKALKELGKSLKTDAQNMIKQQEDSISGVAGILDSIDWESSKEQGGAENISALVQKMTSAQRVALNKTVEGLSDNLSEATAQSYAKTVADFVDSGNIGAVDELQSIFDGVDFSSSLSTIEAFHKASESTNKSVAKIADSLITTEDSAKATAGALQEVYTSDDMKELSEDMDNYIKEQGKLDGSKILEMAESSQSLKRYLDSTGASAEGVARAFTAIGKGQISFDDLTPGVVAAANAMEDFSSSAARAKKAVEGFTITNDSGQYSDALTGAKDSLQEIADAGEWGNDAFKDILGQFFDPSVWEGAYSKGKDGISQLFGKYKDIIDEAPKVISDLYEKGDDTKSLTEKVKQHYKEQGQEISDAAADMLLQTATNLDIDLKRNLEASSPTKMRRAYYEATGLRKEGQREGFQQGQMGSAGDIATQAKLYAGDDIEKQKQFLRDYATSLGIESQNLDATLGLAKGGLDDWVSNLADSTNHIANFNNEMSGWDIAKAIQEDWRGQYGSEQEGAWWRHVGENEGKTKGEAYDIQSIVDYAQRSGASETKALETAYEIAKQYEARGEKFEYQGQELTSEQLADYSSFTQAIQEITDTSQWTQVGQTIGQQIVAALQGVDFLKQMHNGEVDQAFTEKGYDKNAFSGAIEAIKASVSDKGQQQTEVANYLKQSKEQFQNLKPEQQTAALQDVVGKLNELNFKPNEISAAIKDGLGVDLKGGEKGSPLTGEEGKVKLDIESEVLQKQLEGLKITPEIDTSKIETTLGGVEAKVTGSFIGFRGAASGQNNHRFGTFARGSRNKGYTIPGRPTLTGEEGEELVWEPKRNEAFMVGSNGPQFANISRDAVVWNADQTKRIKKNSGVAGMFGLGAKGIRNFGTMGKGGSRGSGATGGGGTKIPGVFQAEVTGNIKDVTPPADPPTIPVKGKLQVEGSEKGGLLSKIKSLFGGGKKGGASINVTANVTKVSQSEGLKTSPVKMTGQVTSVTNNVKKRITGVKATATVTKVTKGKQVSGEPIKVKAKATATVSTSGLKNQEVSAKVKTAGESQVKSLASAVRSLNGKSINVKAKVSGTSEVRNLASAINSVHDKRVSIKATKTVSNGAGATGLGKYTPSGWNSLAKGSGKVGPRGRGGLTLTGEEGFEVAWLPSQNKSLILGTSGPQMVDLPKDVVVWPHKQSKKIMEQKSVPVRSMASGTTYSKVTSKGSGKNKTYTREVIKAGKIGSYVFNLEQKIAQTKNAQERAQKKLNKQLEIASNTVSDIAENNGKNIVYLNRTISLNKKVVASYNKQLKDIDFNKGGKGKRTISWENPTQEKKNKKGAKWKASGSKKHSATINIGAYMHLDPVTGAYVVDYEKINKTFGKNKNKAKAVKEAVEKEISDKTSKRDSAQSAIDEAREKLEELGKQLADTFYNWENELTKITHLNQKLEAQSKKLDRFNSIASLQEAMLDSGLESNFEHAMSFFKMQMGLMVTEIKTRANTIKEQIETIKNLQSSKSKSDEISYIIKKLKGDSNYEAKKKKADAASNKVKNDNKAINAEKKALKSKSSKQVALEIQKAKYQKQIDKANKIINSKSSSRKQKKQAKKNKAAAQKQVKSINAQINTEKKRDKKLNKAQKLSKEQKSAKKQSSTLKSLNARKKAQQKKIDKANKILNSKKSSNKQKKQAKKDKAAAQKQIKSLNSQIKNASKIKKAASKRANAITKGENAKKNLKKDKANAKDAKKAASDAKKDDISLTRREALKARQKELQEQKKVLKASQKYVSAKAMGDGTIELSLNYNKLESDRKAGLISEKLYQEIKKYYDTLSEENSKLNDLYTEQMSQLSDMYDMLGDFKQQLADRAEELLDMTEEAQEEEVDKLEKLNDSLEKALKNLLDEVKKRLDDRRKQEDNIKTEEDISKKQQRLTALRADTSGGHQVEIAQLEKEIKDAQQSYSRSLEDQLVDKLQDQADKASEQRERQIELLNQQLEFAKATGTNVALVNKYLENPEKYKKEIQEIWRAGKHYYDVPDYVRDKLDIDWNNFWNDIKSTGGINDKIAELTKTIKELNKLITFTIAQQLKTMHPTKSTSLKELMGATGLNEAELRDTVKSAGLGYKDLKDMGLSVNAALRLKGENPAKPSKKALEGLRKAGYSASAVLGASPNLTTANLRAAGYNAKQVQAAVNKSTTDKVIQKDMAGMQGGTVDINGNKKGGTVKDSHLSSTGTTIGANKGSTLYTKDWDEKTGKAKSGAWAGTTIDKLTVAQLKKYPIDAKQALIYAIQHTKPGTKINKNFASLTKAAGLTGKYYKLNNGIYGSISGKGWIFYNSGKKGVYKWNPAAGKLAFEKYNKKNFIKQAKNKNIGREYAQVLKANKVKGYKTGGLADQTGPAWLDGTPTKPELVLNAQDTKNFLALKDVLSHTINSMNSAPAAYGDTNVEVNINVDHISSDYDVDRLVQRVKKDITKDMGYRNVTQVRNFR